MKFKGILNLSLTCVLFASHASVYAANSSSKIATPKIFVPEGEVFSVSIDAKKSTKCALHPKKKIFLAGKIYNKKKNQYLDLNSESNFLKKQIKNRLISGKKKVNADKRIKVIKKIFKRYNEACNTSGPVNPYLPTPTPGPTAQLFVEYTEPLSAADVRYLFQKVAYTATDSDLANCVGKTAAWCFDNRINVFDPAEHQSLILEASNYLDGNTQQGNFYGTANGDGQINLNGLQMASAHIMLNSSAQYYARLVFHQLHHHYAFVYGTLGNDVVRQRAAWSFFQKLYTQAQDGSFQKLFRAMTFDPVLQIFLDNANNTKFAPGENFPREVWELYGIGKTDPDGNPNYDNLTDIPQFSKAFTGWVAQPFFDPTTKRNELTITFVAGNHADEDKIIFQGTPHQKSISSLSDAVDATITFPTFGYHQAQVLAKMYLTNEPSKEELLELAQIVNSTDNIHAVIKAIVTSTRNFTLYRGSVMRDGLTTLITPARQLKRLGMSVTPQTIQAQMVNISHEIANSPQGPFGWIPHNRWAGQRMAIINAINALLTTAQPQINGQAYNYCDLLNGLSSSEKSDKATVIKYFSDMFGFAPNNQQMLSLLQYMEFTPTGFDQTTGIPNGYNVAPWNPDPNTQAGRSQCRNKVIGLLKIILASVPASAN